MLTARAALLGACVAALPFAFAGGASAAPGEVLYNADGVPVAILTPLPAAQAAAAPQAAHAPGTWMPWAMPSQNWAVQLIAEQDALMHRMMADFGAMMPSTFAPDQTIQAALRQAQGNGPFSSVVVTSFSSGRGQCSQTVTYSYSVGGAKPQVAVHKVGDACGAIEMPQTRTIPAAQPAQPSPSGPRLLQVEYGHPAQAGDALHG
jgi:hypothetical protein